MFEKVILNFQINKLFSKILNDFLAEHSGPRIFVRKEMKPFKFLSY